MAETNANHTSPGEAAVGDAESGPSVRTTLMENPQQLDRGDDLIAEAEDVNDADNDFEMIVDTSTERLGTIASARFNILSTMVGGGSLSLPLAFQKSGIILGPFLLILVAIISEFIFRIMVETLRTMSPVSPSETEAGKDSYESMISAAFGKKAYIFGMGLVTAMCFFATIGYCVLLRDMLAPITDALYPHYKTNNTDGPNWQSNSVMWAVVFAVTPLCTLQTLTSLKRCGAASMFSVLILGCCVLYRSVQCNLGWLPEQDFDIIIAHDNANEKQFDGHHHPHFSIPILPESWKDLLDVFPLFVSVFVCHYNVVTVHNELRKPSLSRVHWWLKSTTWVATAFYMLVGLSGAMYGKCTITGHVHGNVLLDFSDEDPLLLVGRMCLAVTISLAFPMLAIPARDILLRNCLPSRWANHNWLSVSANRDAFPTLDESDEILFENPLENPMQQPLLAPSGASADEEQQHDSSLGDPGNTVPSDQSLNQTSQVAASSSTDLADSSPPEFPYCVRLVTAVSVFWTAAAVASSVRSIDIVWDLLGSSLSILMSYLIPCGCYLVLVVSPSSSQSNASIQSTPWLRRRNTALAWLLILIFAPLMVVSTINAVFNTFFASSTWSTDQLLAATA